MGISIIELMQWASNHLNCWRYNQKVPEPMHTKNIELSKSSFKEIISFLGKDLTDKLTLLMLNPQQSEIMEYALNLPFEKYAACDDDSSRILNKRGPFIKRSFETNAGYEANQGQVKNAHMILSWNVTAESPALMIVFLYMGLNVSGIIDFRFSRQKITSEDQLDFMRSNDPSIVNSFRLYENGNRIVQELISLDPKEKKESVTQYNLIGDFHSKAAHSHQWIYASNLDFLSNKEKIMPFGLMPGFR